MDPNQPENVRSSLRPVHTNTFALPEDEATKLAYAVYNPSDECRLLKSEEGRTVFAEAFIDNPNLGTLSDLCLRVLAREYGPSSLNISSENSLKRRLQLDAINVDQPLEEIYQIEDKKFWKRIVLAKTSDARLKLNNDSYDWKSEGVTLKFLELVEECPAEFLPESKMCNLATKIKDYVTNIKIRKLQPLQDYSFAHYCGRDSDTDKSTSTDVSDTTEEEKEEAVDEDVAEGEEEGAEEDDDALKSKTLKKVSENVSISGSIRHSLWSFARHRESEDKDDDDLEAMRLIEKLEKQTERRREDRRKRRELQQKRRALREEKRQKRAEELNQPKPKKIKIKDIFGLPIDEPQNDEHKRQDSRNIESYLKFRKKDIYTPNRCHHIDLSFLKHFDNLVSFQIKFQPPELKTNFQSRHFNFSHDDIRNLANGIACLKNLRIFRLRDSRMDEQKLTTLVFSLNQMDIEVVDFGNDNLNDDCDIALRELFQNTTTIKSLELEGNHLSSIALSCLGRAIKRYRGNLEYLGLARNNMGSEGLHAIVSKISGTEQVESLSLAGVQISEMAMLCCISDELLRRHEVLRCLNLMAVPLSSRGGEILTKAMQNNYTVLHLECRGCNLSESLEQDIEIFTQRNRYKAENPFVGDKTQTEAEVKKFASRIKNPILLAANAKIAKQQECMAIRPEIAQRNSSATMNSEDTPVSGFDLSELYRPTVSLRPGMDAPINLLTKSLSEFDYNVMEFDMEDFHEHVNVPGPTNRYYYFKTKKSRNCQNID